MFKRFHEINQLMAHVPADSETSAVNSGWISMEQFREIVCILGNGDMVATSTLDAKVQQATDSSGTGAKDITGAAITQLTAAGSDDDKATMISVLDDDLDVDNGFNHIRFLITPATAAVEFAAFVFGSMPRHAPVATTNWEEVVAL